MAMSASAPRGWRRRTHPRLRSPAPVDRDQVGDDTVQRRGAGMRAGCRGEARAQRVDGDDEARPLGLNTRRAARHSSATMAMPTRMAQRLFVAW